MKSILYLSCHEILEYDELKLFTELGYECYSLGAYTLPGGEENRKRPALKLPYNPHFIELATRYGKEIHEEMLEGIDIVIIMHVPDWVYDNWAVLKSFIDRGGRVIWRSIGQSISHVERQLAPARAEGLEIVRYSPAEETIKDNIGSDAMIRFYKDPAEYDGYHGTKKAVVNFTQSLRQRGEHTGFAIIDQLAQTTPLKVYGPGNDDLGHYAGGLVSYEEQLSIFRDSRAFIYTGTFPASYTLSFIEAMMTGIPIVAVGQGLGNGPMFPYQKTYEVDSIIENEKSGFVSDDVKQLEAYIDRLLDDRELALQVSALGRIRAIELFGKDKIAKEWKEYLG